MSGLPRVVGGVFGERLGYSIDDVQDPIADLSEGVWHSQVRPVAEHYGQGKLAFELHLWGWSVRDDVEPHDVCAVFYRAEPDPPLPDRGDVLDGFGLNRVLRDHSECCVQRPVFVLVPESIQLGQGVNERKIASTVWLKPLDQCPVACGEIPKPTGASSAKPFVVREEPVIWEACHVDLSPGAESREFEHRMVETRREVVNHIADSRSELDRRVLVDVGDNVEALLPSVELHRGAVRIIPKVGVDFRVKRFEMFERRVELREDSFVWVRH